MKKIYTSENKIIIYLLKSKLEQQGISCFIKNENPPLAGEIPPVVAWPELWITTDDKMLEAIKLVQDETKRQLNTNDAWKCVKCGELLEGQFEICWKCGDEKIK